MDENDPAYLRSRPCAQCNHPVGEVAISCYYCCDTPLCKKCAWRDIPAIDFDAEEHAWPGLCKSCFAKGKGAV